MTHRKIAIALLALVVVATGFYWRGPLAEAAMKVVRLVTGDGLVAHWTFDECASCATAADKTGNGNTGTVSDANASGLSNRVSGKKNKALSFDGVDDGVDAANESNFDFVNGIFSFGGWFKTSAAGSRQALVVKGWQWQAEIGTDNKLYAAFGNDGSGQTIYNKVTGGTVNDGLWHHFIAIIDTNSGVEDVRLFLDGIEETTNTINQRATVDYQDGTEQVRLGSRKKSGAVDLLYNGQLDDIRVYNRALSANEIRNLYSEGAANFRSASKTGLVGYWTFDDCDSCTSVADKVFNGHNGSISDANASGLRNRIGGKISNALSFDGTDDYFTVSFDATSPFRQSTAITYSFWVNMPSSGGGSAMGTAVQNGQGSGGVTVLQSGEVTFYWTPTNPATDKSWSKTGIAFSPNTWYHVAVTMSFSGSTSGKIYVDGVDQSATISAAVTDGTPTTSYNNNDNGDSIGGRFVNTRSYFNGKMDDVRIYNRVLTADEITRLYEEGSNRTTVNANQNSNFTGGLVGMWSFNGPDMDWGSASAEVLDRSGNTNNGDVTNFGKEAVRTGIVGQALSFDGTDDYTIVNDSASLDITDNITMMTWVKPRTLSGAGSNGIITKHSSGGASGYLFMVNETKPRIQFGDGVTWPYGNAAANSALSLNTWQHIAVTRSGTQVNFYLNGVNDGSPTVGGNAIAVNTQNLWISSDVNSGGGAFWDGQLDDVRIYNRVLNAAEIQELYLSSARL